MTDKPDIEWLDGESLAYQCQDCKTIIAVKDPNEYGTQLRCVACDELMLKVARKLGDGETEWIDEEYQRP